MSDPFTAIASILTDMRKGRGLHPTTGLGRSMSERVEDVVKAGMTYFAYIDEPASIEWSREDISNYDPDQIISLLEEIKKVWKNELREYVQEHYRAIPTRHGCPDPSECEFEIREA